MDAENRHFPGPGTKSLRKIYTSCLPYNQTIAIEYETLSGQLQLSSNATVHDFMSKGMAIAGEMDNKKVTLLTYLALIES